MFSTLRYRWWELKALLYALRRILFGTVPIRHQLRLLRQQRANKRYRW